MQDEAKKDYLSGMKYKDIAEKYGVSINTVKSWKQRNNWQRGPTSKRVHTKNKKGAHKIEKVAPEIIEEISANDELNDQQKLFCLYYVQRFNATWAYMQAYGVDYRTANVNGPRLLGNASVRKQIDKLRGEIASDLMLTADDIAKQYAKQAFADVGDYVRFGSWPEELKVWDSKQEAYVPLTDNDGKLVIRHNSYVYFNNDGELDTSLIKSVKMGKDGPVIELYDKQKAMDTLMNYVGEKQTLKGQLMQTQIDRLKIQNGDNDPDEDDDDGFIDAIDKSMEGVWTDEAKE
ncbi:terminase small subunit [Latilactobacillus sakei]|uniref:terminase small subunit n=1 Tax=Latilactobacillus sakei TaxID=1599 RepID=UPI000975C9D8|nr:terminase small subunit [Latilactobacillus sakei]